MKNMRKIAFLALTVVAMSFLMSLRLATHSASKTTVEPEHVVVAAQRTPSGSEVKPIRADGAAAIPRPDELKRLLLTTFPTLGDAKIDCSNGCMLIATPKPDSPMLDADSLASPYQGNLERFLLAHGYAPSDSLEIDELAQTIKRCCAFIWQVSAATRAVPARADLRAYRASTAYAGRRHHQSLETDSTSAHGNRRTHVLLQ